MELNFKEWLAAEEKLLAEKSDSAAHTGLYPKGYGGIGLYPLQTFINKSADAITYILQDKRLVKPSDWQGHSHAQHYNTGESGLFDITHIRGPIVSPPPNGEAELDRLGLTGSQDKKHYGYTGEKGMWDITKAVPADPESDPTHDANTGETGKFDITKLRGTVITPKTLENKPWKLYIPPGK